ncbi:MAG: hypothetical protein L3J39_16765 [Verrucomicrobiales bacterium]|nr:hypothetical protein [Verrucomicrobiales bacterium]
MFGKSPLKTLWITSSCLVIGACTLLSAWGEDAVGEVAGKPAKISLQDVPKQFELWADRLGFQWQLTQSGALQSGPQSYFQSAMVLSLNGKDFKTTGGERLDGGEVKVKQDGRVVLFGVAEGLQGLEVTRDIWFDHQRGGVRYLDSFSNKKGKKALRLSVQIKTLFRSTWQDLHGSSGKMIGGKDSSHLGSRDHALLVKYSRTDGRPDTVILVAGDDEVKRPKLSFSSNHRELTFTYDLQVPAGGEVALLHWIMQRNLAAPDEVEQVLRPFYLRRRLLRPEVDRGLAKVVANFAEAALPEHSVQPYSLESLVALQKALRPYRAQRLWEDVLWITQENQLAGMVNEKASLKVETAYGEREVTIAEVAAIQGGGGVGRTPRVFLRDGQVLAGDLVTQGLSMVSGDGWDMQLKVPDLTLLLLQLREVDGKAPAGTDAFVALRSGDVMAVKTDGVEGDDALEILTAWGRDRLSLGEVQLMRYTTGSVPKYRLHRKDGSWLSVFLTDADLQLTLAGGREIQVNPRELIGIWREGDLSLEDKADGDEWLDFEDIGERSALPIPSCLLAGSNLLQGEISMQVLHLVSGGAVTKINPAEIVSMQRLQDQGLMPLFALELSGGNHLKGSLRERSLSIKTPSRTWDIPVQHLVAYLNKEVK